MADEGARWLERSFRASSDPEQEAGWLQSLLRRGELCPERLALAAILGSPGAQQILGVSPPLPQRRSELLEWVHVLVDAGRPCATRAAFALAAAATRAQLDSPELEEVLERGAAALADPSALRRFRPAGFLRRAGGGGKRIEAAQQALVSAHQAMGCSRRMVRAWTQATRSRALGAIGLTACVAALRADLLPWLLSSGEPVDSDPGPALLLFTVEGVRSPGLTGAPVSERPAGAILDPGAFLDDVPSSGAVFRVELRPPGAPPLRCRAEASTPLQLTFASNPAHELLVPLDPSQVPLGTEVWEVGC